jgi:hypothetical protein
MKKSEKIRQGLYNVGFIGIENESPLKTTLCENETTLFENRPITSALDHINANSLKAGRSFGLGLCFCDYPHLIYR